MSHCLYSLETRTPTIVSSTGVVEDAANILECSDDIWTDRGENPEIIIDMGCPEKIQEIQIMNADGDFRTKSFSIYGSTDTTSWNRIFTGELEEAGEWVEV